MTVLIGKPTPNWFIGDTEITYRVACASEEKVALVEVTTDRSTFLPGLASVTMYPVMGAPPSYRDFFQANFATPREGDDEERLTTEVGGVLFTNTAN